MSAIFPAHNFGVVCVLWAAGPVCSYSVSSSVVQNGVEVMETAMLHEDQADQ